MKFRRQEGKPIFTLRLVLQGLIEGMPQDYKIVCDELPSIKNKIYTSAEKRDKNLYWGGVRGVSGKGEFKRSPAILLPV